MFQLTHAGSAGVTIQAPQLDINTVAAGGGSRLFFRTGVFQVSHKTWLAIILHVSQAVPAIQTVTQSGGIHLCQAPAQAIYVVVLYAVACTQVGPESAGAHPGPVCYRKGGYAAITDANLVLGRILPEFFPNIFGPNGILVLCTRLPSCAMQQLGVFKLQGLKHCEHSWSG